MEVRYRQAKQEDADLLIDIYNKSFYADFLRYGECPAYGKTKAQMQKSIATFPKEIIICDNNPAGAMSVENRGNGEYYVGCLCVIPAYQHRGIGTQAIRHLLESHEDWMLLSLITPEDKEENIHFYTQKCGFSIAGTELDGSVRVARLVLERK